MHLHQLPRSRIGGALHPRFLYIPSQLCFVTGPTSTLPLFTGITKIVARLLYKVKNHILKITFQDQATAKIP